MRRGCWDSFSRHQRKPGMLGQFFRHQLQRKPLVSDPSMHHGSCVTHVPWCMSGSLSRGDGENVAGLPGACATRNFTYLARGPCRINVTFTLEENCRQAYASFNPSPPEQNDRHFAYGISKAVSYFIRISLTIVPEGPIDYKAALVRYLTHLTDAYMRHYGQMI